MQSGSPTLKHVESFVVTGLSIRTQNSDEFNKKTAKIPNLWQQFYSSDLAKHTPIYGVYSDYELDANGWYMVTVGIMFQSDKTKLDLVTIQTGNYLVFQNTGAMPITVVETWRYIWDYFAATSEYQRNFISDFEVYSSSDTVAIYIGIQ